MRVTCRSSPRTRRGDRGTLRRAPLSPLAGGEQCKTSTWGGCERAGEAAGGRRGSASRARLPSRRMRPPRRAPRPPLWRSSSCVPLVVGAWSVRQTINGPTRAGGGARGAEMKRYGCVLSSVRPTKTMPTTPEKTPSSLSTLSLSLYPPSLTTRAPRPRRQRGRRCRRRRRPMRLPPATARPGASPGGRPESGASRRQDAEGEEE